MKNSVTLLVIFVLPLAFAQESYTLKGFTLGQSTLSDFKTEFHHCASWYSREGCAFLNAETKAHDKWASKHKGSSPEFGPFCSDDHPLARLTPDRADTSEAWTKAGLVYCQPYIPYEGQFFTIADIKTTAYFDFFQNELYRMTAAFSNYGGLNFKAMHESLIAKYGAPSKQISNEYQNSFGARVAGLTITWDNGVSTIELTEINGSKDQSAVVFTHKQTATDAAAAAPKGASKDL